MRALLPLAALLLAQALPASAEPAPVTVEVPAGPFLAGSTPAERDYAYRLDEAADGDRRARAAGRYEQEQPQHEASTGAFRIMLTPVTNADYARFVAATGHAAPGTDPDAWAAAGAGLPFERTRRHAWRNGAPPPARADHPVVLVSHEDAEAYAAWLSTTTGGHWRLPTELEWEKAARGPDGAYFPWGDEWDPEVLNSADLGPADTTAVGSYLHGGSVHGMVDAAGQVQEWTASPEGPGRYVVKGGAWDQRGCGACRPAARAARPEGMKHILIGFRLVLDEPGL
jgi:formylglycine-generating enzyme required for sulfatase activity